MGFLTGKRLLITGVLSTSSLAYGIAKACAREGAELAFTYQDDRVAKRVQKLAAQLNSDICFPCDVSDDAQIDHTFERLGAQWESLDGLVHAIGFAPSAAIAGDFRRRWKCGSVSALGSRRRDQRSGCLCRRWIQQQLARSSNGHAMNGQHIVSCSVREIIK